MCIRDRYSLALLLLLNGCQTGKPRTPQETGAVSYTHLDVYKRQVFAGAAAAAERLPDGQAADSARDRRCLLYTSRCV
ncbi:hypothetical protein [Erwinia amylovora]